MAIPVLADPVVLKIAGPSHVDRKAAPAAGGDALVAQDGARKQRKLATTADHPLLRGPGYRKMPGTEA